MKLKVCGALLYPFLYFATITVPSVQIGRSERREWSVQATARRVQERYRTVLEDVTDEQPGIEGQRCKGVR